MSTMAKGARSTGKSKHLAAAILSALSFGLAGHAAAKPIAPTATGIEQASTPAEPFFVPRTLMTIPELRPGMVHLGPEKPWPWTITISPGARRVYVEFPYLEWSPRFRGPDVFESLLCFMMVVDGEIIEPCAREEDRMFSFSADGRRYVASFAQKYRQRVLLVDGRPILPTNDEAHQLEVLSAKVLSDGRPVYLYVAYHSRNNDIEHENVMVVGESKYLLPGDRPHFSLSPDDRWLGYVFRGPNLGVRALVHDEDPVAVDDFETSGWRSRTAASTLDPFPNEFFWFPGKAQPGFFAIVGRIRSWCVGGKCTPDPTLVPGKLGMSADGSRLAFVHKRREPARRPQMLPPSFQWTTFGDMRGPEVLEVVGSPVVAPNGSHVAYIGKIDKKSMQAFRDAEPLGKAMPEINEVVLSADGQHTAWAGGGKCKEIRRKTGSICRYQRYSFLDGQRGKEYDWVEKLVFSPDGSRLAYAARKPKTEKWVLVVGDKESEPYDWVDKPIWSSDGKKVAFGARLDRTVYWKVLESR